MSCAPGAKSAIYDFLAHWFAIIPTTLQMHSYTTQSVGMLVLWWIRRFVNRDNVKPVFEASTVNWLSVEHTENLLRQSGFGVQSFPDLSYTTFKEVMISAKTKGTSFPLDRCPTLNSEKFRHGTSSVADYHCCQQSTDDRRLLITLRLSVQLCVPRDGRAWQSASRGSVCVPTFLSKERSHWSGQGLRSRTVRFRWGKMKWAVWTHI